MLRKVLDRVLQGSDRCSSLCQRCSAMKRNKALIRCLDWHDRRLCRCRGKVTMCTAHLMSLVKMPQLTTHHIVFCGEMEMVSIQPTLKHKYQLNNKILMEELLRNRNNITEPRKYVWNSIIVSITEHALWRLSLSIIFVPRFLLP